MRESPIRPSREAIEEAARLMNIPAVKISNSGSQKKRKVFSAIRPPKDLFGNE